MPTFNQLRTKHNLTGEAVNREQMRNADLDREEKNKKFPTIFVKRYGFRPFYTPRDTVNISGPLCPGFLTKERQCLSPLTGEDAQSTKSHCEVCNLDYDMPHSFDEFRRIADKAYKGYLNSKADIITLDIPYEAVKAEAEDEMRKVKVVWSQKDGRNQAIIYFINKDKNGEKAHIFADMDKEEIRYDSGGIPPGELLAKIKAVFKSTNIDIEYKNIDKNE